MKCLLISLQSNSYVTGLKYIAASVLARGHDVRILLLSGYLDRELHPAIEDFIRGYAPDLIGISLMAIEYYPAKNLTRLLREKFQSPIIWGGVHVTTNPEDCFKHADYLCIGEGEAAVPALLEHLNSEGRGVLPAIPGVWAHLNGNETRLPCGAPEVNLDKLPVQDYLPPYFYGFHKGEVYNFAEHPGLFRGYALYGGTCHMMITTRGCPFNCGYCANASLSKVYGRKVRERSVENCMEELKRVKKDPYVLYINFQDDCFFIHDTDWLKQFCGEYKKYINLPFMVRAIPSLLDREKLDMLKEAGLSVVIMGIQSGSDRVNFDIYNRKIKFQSVMKAADIISNVRVLPYYEMIVDNPYETEDDMIETINSMSRLKKPYTISLAHLTFFPGTPLTERALKDKIVDPEAYLNRFMVNIDYTYLNKVLYLTPYIPGRLINFLNRPAASRRMAHALLTNIIFFIGKRSVEPLLYMFLIARSLNYNIKWTARTVFGNWRSALAKLLFNFLSKGDMEFNKRLAAARREMPSLFER
jgi:radical SAM superfamily enzyme YgiQ (UPF0313 family)